MMLVLLNLKGNLEMTLSSRLSTAVLHRITPLKGKHGAAG